MTTQTSGHLQQFRATLVHDPQLDIDLVWMPFSAVEAFGRDGIVHVKGEINGVRFKRALTPYDNGHHYLAVNSRLKEDAGIDTWQEFDLTLDLDNEKRELNVPQELQDFLEANVHAQDIFRKMAYNHQKEYASYVSEAKKTETRERRAEKVVAKLLGL